MRAASTSDSRAIAARRRPQPRSVLVVDLRRYRRHRGNLLIADRLYLGGRWTPLVRVRVRLPRLSDGGAEI